MIDDLIREESIAEIRHLHDNWRVVEPLESGAIDGVLVGTGDEALFSFDVIGQHRDIAGRRCRYDIAEASRLGQTFDRLRAVAIVDQRPAPDVSEPTDHRDIFFGHNCARWRSGNIYG
jgi:hypothetical protein